MNQYMYMTTMVFRARHTFFPEMVTDGQTDATSYRYATTHLKGQELKPFEKLHTLTAAGISWKDMEGMMAKTLSMAASLRDGVKKKLEKESRMGTVR